MMFSTFLTFFIVPATYITVERIRERVLGPAPEPASAQGEP